MIELLVPPGVVPVEAFADTLGEDAFPGEEDLVARSVAQRRLEFITARRCAREALIHLGCPPAPIRSGAHREPQWPAGVVGSITHCTGYRAAAVAFATVVASLGIDAEPHGRLPTDVMNAVIAGEEIYSINQLARTYPQIHWETLFFSAKESVYKAWFPLTARWLGFEDAQLSIDPVACTFAARLLVDGVRSDGGPPLTEVRGRYVLARELVVTAAFIPT